MISASAISADRAKTEIATPERRFEVFQGAAGLTAIREDWNRVTRALDKPRFFHFYEWYESYLNTLSDSPVYFVLARRKGAPAGGARRTAPGRRRTTVVPAIDPRAHSIDTRGDRIT